MCPCQFFPICSLTSLFQLPSTNALERLNVSNTLSHHGSKKLQQSLPDSQYKTYFCWHLSPAVYIVVVGIGLSREIKVAPCWVFNPVHWWRNYNDLSKIEVCANVYGDCVLPCLLALKSSRPYQQDPKLYIRFGAVLPAEFPLSVLRANHLRDFTSDFLSRWQHILITKQSGKCSYSSQFLCIFLISLFCSLLHTRVNLRIAHLRKAVCVTEIYDILKK